LRRQDNSLRRVIFGTMPNAGASMGCVKKQFFTEHACEGRNAGSLLTQYYANLAEHNDLGRGHCAKETARAYAAIADAATVEK
jgi:hypothetical protein